MQGRMGYWKQVKPSWLSHHPQYHCVLHEAYSCLGDIPVITSWRERDWQPHHLSPLLWNLQACLGEKHMDPAVTPKQSFPSSALPHFLKNLPLHFMSKKAPVVCKSHRFVVSHDQHIEINQCLQQPDTEKDFLAIWAAHLIRCCISVTKRA